jgi:carbamoyl-phosphate synthase large subunit
MMNNILITSAGRRVSLVRYFQQEAQRLLGAATKVYTTDLEPALSAAAQVSDGSFKVGRFTDADYMDVLLQLCLSNGIGLVVPTIDTELTLLAQHRAAFAQKGITLLVCDLDFVQTCRDKRKINLFFEQYGFQLPKTIDRNNLSYPFFVKPYDGSSSKNVMRIDGPEMVNEWLLNNEKLMFMEYLSPTQVEEYTVDMYYDKNGHLQCTVPRLRMEVRNGEISKGITRKNNIIEFLQANLAQMNGWRGCITLQLFRSKTSDAIYGIEINPRFGGGYPLSYLSGANFPAWIIEEYLLGKTVAAFDGWKANTLLLRHDNEMIIENATV